jgi:hypothetical protein
MSIFLTSRGSCGEFYKLRRFYRNRYFEVQSQANVKHQKNYIQRFGNSFSQNASSCPEHIWSHTSLPHPKIKSVTTCFIPVTNKQTSSMQHNPTSEAKQAFNYLINSQSVNETHRSVIVFITACLWTPIWATLIPFTYLTISIFLYHLHAHVSKCYILLGFPLLKFCTHFSSSTFIIHVTIIWSSIT